MAIEKLLEFAKDGQKNTDDLNLTDGFPVSKKPARQWFNWLFNSLTSKVNEIIDAEFIPKAEIVDNLTTNDATKPVSAKQAKVLQDNKLEKNANAVSATKLQTARTIAISGAVTGTATSFDGSGNIAIATTAIDGSKISTGTIPAARIPAASTSAAGAVKLNNTLTSTSTTEALTAAQGKVLNDQAFGVGQIEKDVTALRSLNTVYTNPTDKTIVISLSGGSGFGCNLYINNKLFAQFTGSFSQSGAYAYIGNVTWLIPPHAEYELKANGSKPTIWSEIS